jgi:AraC-like DNA-binding protein
MLAADPAPRQLDSLPSTGGFGIRCAVRRMRALALDPEPLLKRAGITAEEVADPTTRFAVRSQIRFLELASDRLRDDLLGFHLARDFEPRELGLLHYVVVSAPRVDEALARMARFSALVHDGMQIELALGRELRIGLEYVGVSRRSDRHQAECWITALLDLVRRLTGRREVPRVARFLHERGTVPGELARHFGCPVEFGAGADELVFEGAVATLPVVSADPYLSRLLLRFSEEALRDRPRERGSFRTAVENAIVPELPHGEVQADRIARRLGMSRRTFARKLAAEGVTFSELLDRLRLDLARRYLSDSRRSISTVAWLLGYREASAFSRAFRRWTGHSPRAARTGAIPSRR